MNGFGLRLSYWLLSKEKARDAEVAELVEALEHMIEEYESVNGGEPWHDKYRTMIAKHKQEEK